MTTENETGSEPVAFKLPSLANFEKDAEQALQAAEKMLTFATTYGTLIPGLGQYIALAGTLEKMVNGALALFKA